MTGNQQQRNKRNNRLIEYNGETHCIAEWAEITGIRRGTIGLRLKYGWRVEDALTVKPTRKNARAGYGKHRKLDKSVEQEG